MAIFDTYLQSHRSYARLAAKPMGFSVFVHGFAVFVFLAFPLLFIKSLPPPAVPLGVFEAAPPPPPPPPPPGGSATTKPKEEKPKTPDVIKEPTKVSETIKKDDAPKNDGGVVGGVQGGVVGGVVGGVIGGVVGGSLNTSAKPDYLNNPPPDYPTSSRRREEEGVVVLSVLVSPAGEVLSVELAKTSGYDALDQSALSAVKHWKFKPGLVGGVPKQQKVLVPVRFKLEN